MTTPESETASEGASSLQPGCYVLPLDSERSAEAGTELLPYEHAKGLAVACADRREAWLRAAYEWWLVEYEKTGDATAQDSMSDAFMAWKKARDVVAALRDPSVMVGGSWLHQAMRELERIKPPNVEAQRPRE